jgi:hypothetical protein
VHNVRSFRQRVLDVTENAQTALVTTLTQRGCRLRPRYPGRKGDRDASHSSSGEATYEELEPSDWSSELDLPGVLRPRWPPRAWARLGLDLPADPA